MLHKIETLKCRYDVPAASLVAITGLSTANYMRLKRRVHRGDEPVQKPGVKKTQPIDLRELSQRIGSLNHGKKRFAGAGQLYAAHKYRISRRQFNDMVKQVRGSTNRQKAATRCQVVWLRPNVAWALDGAIQKPPRSEPAGFVLEIQVRSFDN